LRRNLESDILATLNGGSLKELMKMAGVGKKRAESIIQFREGARPLKEVGRSYGARYQTDRVMPLLSLL